MSFIPLLFFFNTILGSIENYYRDEREKRLLTYSIILANSVSKSNYLFIEPRNPVLEQGFNNKSGEYGSRILILNSRGIVEYDSNGTDVGKTYLVPEFMSAVRGTNMVSTRIDEQVIYAGATISSDNNEVLGAVILVSSIGDIYAASSEIERELVFFSSVAIFVLILLVFLMSQLLIEPLNNTLQVVQKMSEGHLNARIKVKGFDEFSRLGSSFNDMAKKLEQVEKTREEFVSNVSHELKTPLSSIKVLTESILLQENVPTEMYTEFLQDINSEIDRMTNIVNDLLNLVKLDQREIGLNFKQIDLNKLLEDILKRLNPLAEQKDILLSYDEIRKILLEADEMKLSLAISNLVENAIKYTPNKGSVKVIVDADHQNAFIKISDTGIGINDEDQKKVFNRFYRVDKTRDRETGGTGLGLSITHSTILLHNGSIKILSKENEGATFVVRIPILQ